ncbi:acrylyl-CoA reductase (NADPH) [Fodinicurvata sediminis]|uniref:acrylyl-CoA reductase (NADPH) n=1 Tax=Fodinicurvata sediminis TaxID=1121832 RepID=UPI0003B669C4|nr:MDR family oxidoreductase [Fodinicurvata sediminis]
MTRGEDKKTHAELTEVDEAELPEGDVLVDVKYSTLNYKDGLAITGKGPVVRSFPMIPGVDFAGVVAESDHSEFKAGDAVISTGWGLGEERWGGYAERARVQGDWLVPLPKGMTLAQAMTIGTAGFTAMLCVMRLNALGLKPDSGPVVVTGASGGVGSVAVSLLAGRGYQVSAMTGRVEEEGYLKDLGASEVIDRTGYSEPGKPLQKGIWAGAVDTVGGQILANILASTQQDGIVAACGLAASMDLPTTVAPFILRNVTLAGVESVYTPRALRLQAWENLARELDAEALERISHTVGLTQVIPAASDILAGKVRGRMIVDIAA